MLIDIPENVKDIVLADLQHVNCFGARIVVSAMHSALAQEKADTKYVNELIASADDSACYAAYQFITGVENRRRLLNHLNRIQPVEVNRCVRCDNMTNYKQTLCSDCEAEVR